MRKFFLQSVALLCISCLIGDPGLTLGLQRRASSARTLSGLSLLEIQALALPASAQRAVPSHEATPPGGAHAYVSRRLARDADTPVLAWNHVVIAMILVPTAAGIVIGDSRYWVGAHWRMFVPFISGTMIGLFGFLHLWAHWKETQWRGLRPKIELTKRGISVVGSRGYSGVLVNWAAAAYILFLQIHRHFPPGSWARTFVAAGITSNIVFGLSVPRRVKLIFRIPRQAS